MATRRCTVRDCPSGSRSRKSRTTCTRGRGFRSGSPQARPANARSALSYLAHGFAWKSDYVARLNAAGNRMDLTGWLTLQNLTQANFRGRAGAGGRRTNCTCWTRRTAASSLIGDSDDFSDEWPLNDAREEALDNSCRRSCEPKDSDAAAVRRLPRRFPVPAARTDRALRCRAAWPTTSIVTGCRGSMRTSMDIEAAVRSTAEREELGDYQLYRLPWATDLNARQTKQAVFLAQTSREGRALLQLLLRRRRDFADESKNRSRPTSILGFREPQGCRARRAAARRHDAHVRNHRARGDVFAGEGAHERQTREHAGRTRRWQTRSTSACEISVERPSAEELATRNARRSSTSSCARQRQGRAGDPRDPPATSTSTWRGATITESSQRAVRKYGDFAWRLRVPANGEQAAHLPARRTGRHGAERQ